MTEPFPERSGVLSLTARLEALTRTGLDAVADATFDRFAEMVRTVLRVPVALVSLVGDDRQFFPGACGLGDPWAAQRQTPLSHSFCQHVVAASEPLVVVDARTDPRVRGNLAIEDLGVIGYAGMPLTDADGQVLGSLCAIDHEPRDWTDAELALLADLAAACSDSLRLRITAYWARRHEQRAAAAFDRNLLLLRASTALAGADSLDGLVDAVHELIADVLDPAYVGVSVIGPGRHLTLASARLLPSRIADRWARYPSASSTPTALAVRTGRPVVLPDPVAVAAETPDALATFAEMGWQSAVSVPLPGPAGPVGALTFTWDRPYAPDDAGQAVLVALAGYTAQALVRVTALDDRRTAAATMQKALLTPLPAHDHLRMAARYVPAHHEDHVGGDWYDAISLGEERLALVIGDVAGHSIGAAAAMSQYRSMMRTLLVDRDEPPSALLRRLEHTSRSLGHPELTTVLVAHLDPAPAGGHVLTWANAGHPPPLVVLPDGGVDLLDGHDPLIGAARRTSRRNHTRYLPPGTTLVLYTDGLVETRTATLDDGLDVVRDLLRREHRAGPDTLADLLIRHGPVVTGEDDVALLIVATPPHP
ncbi:GAF domain-containing SpoIIE family protein phosphatase [Catenuloplanes indicus]|uniref:GAF domain-containing protein n=1 Tax=Catenuloplanes indicus TaxID=137267 RepID=A0AAE3W733_9ACTN|nr:SpoIIE family protein phosphatase [Catenuloplanes indicus]MDQ0370836.1 GAF domain-containing protein [Catenuloplanes indicus]